MIVTLFFMGLNKALSLFFGLGPQTAFLASYPPALALHFGLNKWWTFGDRRTTTARHVGDYLFSVVATFLIQWPAFTLLQEGFHLRGWIAAGGANALQMAVSYILLKKRVFKADSAEGPAQARSSWHRLALLLTTVALSALLAWTSLGTWSLPKLGPKQYDYFNLLVSGFRKGSLALDVPVPPELIALKNPYDASRRPAGIAPHDVSYYKGKYYIYFGVVPIVTLFWPFRVLFGCDLSMTYAAVVYGVGGFWIAGWLWTRILRDHFPKARLATKLAGLVAVGIAGGQLVVARRTSFWEIPIEAGYFHILCFVAAAYLAVQAKRAWLWLALAGLFLGLAVGCRPTLVGAGLGLALVVAWAGARAGSPRSTGLAAGPLVRAAASAGLPFAAILAGLFAYNAARFGRPLEFGLTYQLTGSEDQTRITPFSPSYILYNLRTYFLSRPQWGRYFPFVHPARPVRPPAGYYGTEFTYGALVVCPLTWFCAAFPAWAFRRRTNGALFLGFFFLLGAVGTTSILAMFNSSAGRYVEDFLPWWIWVGVLGALSLERLLDGRCRTHSALAVSLALALCAVFSGLVEFFQSADLHGVFRFENAKGFERVSRYFDLPAAWIERMSGERLGALSLDITFPDKAQQPMMPVVVAGVGYQSDYLFASTTEPHRARLGYLPSGGRPLVTEEFSYEPGKPYHLRLSVGSIFPPAGHPAYDGWREAEVRSLKDWAEIDLDGHPVVNAPADSHDATPGYLQFGEDRNGGICGTRFDGSIANIHRGELLRPANGDRGTGDLILDVTLPEVPSPSVQPLVVFGKTGWADLVGIRMSAVGWYTLYYESWGAGAIESDLLPVPEGREATLRFKMGSDSGGAADPGSAAMRQSIVVWMNGAPAWWTKQRRAMPAHPKLEIGVNSIGSSATVPYFAGRIRGWSRDPGSSWHSGAFSGLYIQLGGAGSGSEPLVATGTKGRADTLALEWLAGGRARLHYDHWGRGEQVSPPFAWPVSTLHTLRVTLPSFASLDSGRSGEERGTLSVLLDGRALWTTDAHYFPADSQTLRIGRNDAGSSVARIELTCVVADVRQVSEAATVAR